MLIQLLIGIALTCLTIFLTIVCFAIASLKLSDVENWLQAGRPSWRLVGCLMVVVLWMLVVLAIAVFVWSVAFYATGELKTFEESVYFSLVSFTTLRFGDIIISENWRLLSGILAANGFLLFSLATAFLIEFLTRIRDTQIGE